MKKLRGISTAAMLVLFAGLAAAAPGDPAPVRVRLDFGERQVEAMMQPGEPVRLRDKASGEILELRASRVEGAARMRFEVKAIRRDGTVRESEVVDLGLGETAKSGRLDSYLNLQLLDAPFNQTSPGALATGPERFEVNLTLPEGRMVMAVGDVRPDEVVRLRDRSSGIFLGFRPALGKPNRPADVEIFAIDRKADGSESYRQLARLPLGGEFNLSSERLNLSPNASSQAPFRIKGNVKPADPAMWDGMALAGRVDDIVHLRARWDGGPWIEGSSYGGQMFRLEVPGVTGEIGLTEAEPGSLQKDTSNLAVFHIEKIAGHGENLRHLETLPLRGSETAILPAFGQRLEVQILRRGPAEMKGVCWVGCGGGISAHGCGVSCSDTDCCVGACCRY